MKTEKEIREETRRIRVKARSLSGFWVAELASAAYSLEWALGKHDRTPSEDIGGAESAQGRIAASLVKAAEKEAATSARKSTRAPKAQGKRAGK